VHGRVAFANSDWATEWPGWIAGAIHSGHDAATRLSDLLA
jgi:monoamine oxidase